MNEIRYLALLLIRLQSKANDAITGFRWQILVFNVHVHRMHLGNRFFHVAIVVVKTQIDMELFVRFVPLPLPNEMKNANKSRASGWAR